MAWSKDHTNLSVDKKRKPESEKQKEALLIWNKQGEFEMGWLSRYLTTLNL